MGAGQVRHDVGGAFQQNDGEIAVWQVEQSALDAVAFPSGAALVLAGDDGGGFEMGLHLGWDAVELTLRFEIGVKFCDYPDAARPRQQAIPVL